MATDTERRDFSGTESEEKAESKNDRRQVMIPEELWDQVKAVAKKDTTSASQIVRKALQLYIDARQKRSGG